MSNMLKIFSFISILALFSSCSTTQQSVLNAPPKQVALKSGLTGGLVGVGTGAVIGAVIKNGVIGQSALLGGVVGVPAGMLIAVGYQKYKRNQVVGENQAQINKNATFLKERKKQIQKLREQLTDESFQLLPNKGYKSNLYTGSTIGN